MASFSSLIVVLGTVDDARFFLYFFVGRWHLNVVCLKLIDHRGAVRLAMGTFGLSFKYKRGKSR